MISINQLSVSFGGTNLFDNISFIVKDRDRIGLTGKNGAGKSTMLKILAGIQSSDAGQIVISRDHKIGYLPQEMIPDSTKTVLDEALSAFSEIRIIEKKLDSLQKELVERQDYESDEYSKLIEDIHHLSERYEILGGHNSQAKAEKILLGLGFIHKDFQRFVSEFSSGWQMRIELAKILLQNPEVMLLDEPTNHLDIDSIEWLEEFLQSYQGAVILVSHDRKFLDNVTNRTIEIILGRIDDYQASYSEYLVQRAERRESQQNAYENQQKEIENMERFIERFRYKASKAKQAQSKLKSLEKMNRIEIDVLDQSAISFRFPPAPHSGKLVLNAVSLSKSYGEKLVFKNIDICIERGEKIALVGKNGQGKSTFSKIVVGEITDATGECTLGHQVKIGYFAQNQAALLDGEKTVFQTIDEVAIGEVRTRIRNILGSFLFSGDDIEKKVKVLSGGEKTRLALAKLLLEPVNLLVLDEPTNHLDLRSKDILKNALLRYDGSMMIVSHDRDFLEGLTEKVYEFNEQKVKLYIGDVSEFLNARKLENLHALNEKEIKQKKGGTKSEADNKLSWEEKKSAEKELRKRRSAIEKLEQEIEQIESKIAEYEERFTKENKQTTEDFEAYKKQQNLLQSKMHEWEMQTSHLENLN